MAKNKGASLRDRAVVNGAASVSALRASVPSAMERVSVAEFRERLVSQGVPDINHAALVCPVCGTVQSMASLVEAGASPEMAERYIGFSCEGRVSGAGAWPRKPSKARAATRGCDWTLGGLFTIHRLEVETEDGVLHPRFTVAEPADAQALAQAIEARRAETQSGSVHESAVAKPCAPTGGDAPNLPPETLP